jgi:energy-converting hydrogenase Eha subunit G
MPGAVYLLCAATALLCAVLLFRGYARSRVRLLFWSGLCFTGLMIDNVLLYIDIFVVPEVDLEIWRKIPGLLAIMLLVYGLVWDSK